MAYQAIYRKWRPLVFEDVVGQSHIVNTLKTELVSGKVAHAYLFCGTRGTGKTTTAKILSRAVNCENPLPNGNPCNTCDSCKGILNGTVMDVSEIDAASNNGVDNIRELRDEIIYSPANSKYKVYIIDEVHMLSPGAFNALLKTLEEPPPHAIFILATTEAHKIPATIQSRCQRFDFKRISKKHIAGRIGEIVRNDGLDITEDAIKLVAEAGDGSMRDALSVLDLCTGIEGKITASVIEEVAGIPSKKTLLKITAFLIDSDFKNAVITLSKMIDNGSETNNILDGLILAYRELLMCKMIDNPIDILDKSDEDIAELKEISKKSTADELIHAIRLLSDYVPVCKVSNNPRILLETAFVKLCNPECDPSTNDFNLRIAKLERAFLTNDIKAADVPKVTEPLPVKEEKAPVPPVSDEMPPLPMEPPFEADNTIVPVFDEPIVEKVKEETLKTEVRSDDDYEKIKKAIAAENAAAASLLKNTTREIINDTVYIIFNDEFLKETFAKNQTFAGAVKKVLNTENVKFITEKEKGETKTDNKDPFDDILALGETMEQISIF